MRPLLRSTCLLALLLTIAGSAQAQGGEPRRHGFWFSLGLGGGSVAVTCPECDAQSDERLNGIAGYVRFGGTVSPHLLVGIEGTGWVRNDEGFERRIATASATALLYPDRNAGFFLKGSIGGIRAVVENSLLVAVGEGLTWQVGVGIDVYLGRGAALTPFLTYVGSSQVGTTLNGIDTGISLNPNIVQVGLALTIP